ncbi:cation:proton antiporter, partial [Burkholderia ambifaria]|uniref:cation:proton antiporter domain-containing protein n=1 Tax=Burkholderia ambifaria TaxID=152480 RepID=UPI00158D5928
IRFIKLLTDDYLITISAVLGGWVSYIAGETLEVSGVISTVTMGMMLGWHQHEIFSAMVRVRSTAFWKIMVFLLEALVFVLIGLSLPEAMPGRDMILVAAFAVILVTVLLQGTTIGPLIRLVSPHDGHVPNSRHLTEPRAWARMSRAQLAAIQPLVRDAEGKVIHPRLLEQYSYRMSIAERFEHEPSFPTEDV